MIRVWVDGLRWREVDSLAGAGPDEHVFAVDRDAGRIVFGDSVRGQRPPLGAEAVAAVYEHRGGRSGHDTGGNPPVRATGLDVRDRTDLAVWTVSGSRVRSLRATCL
jgi:hypothetical protein